jgi:hypothetical protein
VTLTCETCGRSFDRGKQARFCSRKCYGANASTKGLAMPAPRIPPRRRMDSELIGAVFMRWDGAPILLGELAALLADDPREVRTMVEDLELRGGLLASWCVAVLSARGMVLCGRNESYSDLRAYLDSLAVCNLQTEVWMQEEAA